MRTRTFWLLTLPALFVAETAAHTVVARALDPHEGRHGLLAGALESYGLPLLALGVLLAGAMLGRRVLASFRAEGPQSLPGWRLAALAAAGFLVQEQLETIAQDHDAAWLIVLEPAVVVGMAVQLLCGLLAIWLVRTLLRAADQLGHTLARRGVRGARSVPRLRVRPFETAAPKLAALASQQAGRAPPAVA